jgi:hypothetical protein
MTCSIEAIPKSFYSQNEEGGRKKQVEIEFRSGLPIRRYLVSTNKIEKIPNLF